MKTKIVVTGGAGFIGSHIVEYWLNQNAEVHVIDNLRSGFEENVKIFPDVNFHFGSVTDKDLVFNVLKNTDYIHHLAALVSVPESVLKPEECYEINVLGTINILEASKEYNVKKVVFSSSAAIYGDNPESPKRISMKPEPKTPYAETKLEGEKLLQEYFQKFNLGTVSLRYFNVFGPRQDPKSQYAAAIPIFISKALRNEKITIYGDGEQTRDFIYVKDVVKANVLAATNEKANGVFNVARGNAITINQIAKKIIEELNSKSEIEYQPERLGDIKHSLASIDETKNELNFSPSYELDEGLKETIKYFEKLYK
ncbi:MAG: SDR family oxidoreductase [Melioribacteraceae bacterium]|nr:SDR family oxidoreductase [Melioribacteraceae bacterium]